MINIDGNLFGPYLCPIYFLMNLAALYKKGILFIKPHCKLVLTEFALALVESFVAQFDEFILNLTFNYSKVINVFGKKLSKEFFVLLSLL